MLREDLSIALSHPTLDELASRTSAWLAENSKGGSDIDAWEAASSILTAATYNELGEAVQEVLAAAVAGDRDAEDVVAAFNRLHPPQSLSNPERQRSLVGNYLVLRQQAHWDASGDNPDTLWRENFTRTSH